MRTPWLGPQAALIFQPLPWCKLGLHCGSVCSTWPSSASLGLPKFRHPVWLWSSVVSVTFILCAYPDSGCSCLVGVLKVNPGFTSASPAGWLLNSHSIHDQDSKLSRTPQTSVSPEASPVQGQQGTQVWSPIPSLNHSLSFFSINPRL